MMCNEEQVVKRKVRDDWLIICKDREREEKGNR